MIPEETIRRALAAIKSSADYDYFFRNLNSPEWIEPLRKEGLFAKPEPPTAGEDARYYLPWPPSQYLARMAPSAPDPVAQTFENMELDDNAWVHRDIVAAALRMPAAHAARLAEIEARWLERQTYVSPLLAPDYAKLLATLTTEGKTRGALRLLGLMIEALPDAKGPSHSLWETRSRLGPHERDDVLAQVLPKLADAIPDELLALLCDVLDGAIKAARFNCDLVPPHDLSEFWRPAIEEHEQNDRHHLAGTLTSAVRDVAVQIATTRDETLASVVTSLEKWPWLVFRRIAMHTLCEAGRRALDLARPKILDRTNFDNLSYRHEYAHLLRTFFGHLAEPEQVGILAWIEEGPPDLQEWIDSCERKDNQPPTPEQIQDRSDYWKLERVHPFRDSLPGEWCKRHAAWVQRFGEPKLAELLWRTETRFGDSGPMSAEEIARLETSELIHFLTTWRPSGEWDGPTLRGLTEELQRAVVIDPPRFSQGAAAFKALPPEHVSAILIGFGKAVTFGKVFSWPPVLELCEWVTQQPRDLAGREGEPYHPLEPHPGWKWTRAAVADLLEQGLQHSPSAIPGELRAAVWSILAPLADDPDPTPEREKNRNAAFEPLMASLNCTRGKAIHAVVRYLVWVARHSPRPPDTEPRLERGMQDVAKARDLLELHLDPGVDSSLAIRAIFGCHFPLLAALDPTWVAACRGRIFPSAEIHRPYWEAAWRAYVGFNNVYTGVFELLKEDYARAIQRCGPYPTDNDEVEAATRGLANHLIVLLGRGTIEGPPGGLMDQFFSSAPDGLQEYAVTFVGESLSHENPPPADVIDRFKRLWAWLVTRAQATNTGAVQRARLTGFRSWFTSRRFDAPWSIRALSDMLALAGGMRHPCTVIRTLAEFANDFPGECVRCLDEIVRSDTEGWDISGAHDAARAILKTALSNADEGVRKDAERLVHALGARGFSSFRDLLARNASS